MVVYGYLSNIFHTMFLPTTKNGMNLPLDLRPLIQRNFFCRFQIMPLKQLPRLIFGVVAL